MVEKWQLILSYHLSNCFFIFVALYFVITKLPTDPSSTAICHFLLISKLSFDCDLLSGIFFASIP
jgi:hypothetical protein